MVVTESQAVTMWCPMVRAIARADDAEGMPVTAVNCTTVLSLRHEDSPCVATRCMFWRWHDQEKRGSSASAVERRGFCGAACRPPVE